MSEYVFKAGIRFRLQGVDEMTPSEIAMYFESLFGVAPEYFDGESEPEYDCVADNWYPRNVDGKWFIEWVSVIGYSAEINCEFAADVPLLAEIVMKFIDCANIAYPQFVVFAYQWYNGVDEPLVEVN